MPGGVFGPLLAAGAACAAPLVGWGASVAAVCATPAVVAAAIIAATAAKHAQRMRTVSGISGWSAPATRRPERRRLTLIVMAGTVGGKIWPHQGLSRAGGGPLRPLVAAFPSALGKAGERRLELRGGNFDCLGAG